jgi:L-ascorbate metabolism protein UlaG (beta-lactamase superfamily)
MPSYLRLLLPAALLAAGLASSLSDAQQAPRPGNAQAMTQAAMRRDKGEIIGADAARRPARGPQIDPLIWPNDSLTVANLGHSTLLMNFFGARVIADPVLLDKIGIAFGRWLTLGPRRLTPVPLEPSRLGPLNAILITHAHMDHLDLPSLGWLPKSAVVIACSGCADLIRPLGFADVRELKWGESTEVDGLRITAFGARHWGRRLPWEKDRGFDSYLLDKNDTRMLLACDSAYTPMFRELAPLKLALAAFSVGAYDPWIAHHANPEQAWKMFRDSGAEYLLPIHWGTFRLSKEPLNEPLRRLADVAGAEQWRIVAAEIGEPWRLPDSRPAGSARRDPHAAARSPAADD